MISRLHASYRPLAIVRAVAIVGLTLLVLFASPALVRAQSPAPVVLPTAPGAAQKAGMGGYTGAKASLPGENGSPLEPYLFLFILAGGGVIAWAAAIVADVRIRREPRVLKTRS